VADPNLTTAVDRLTRQTAEERARAQTAATPTLSAEEKLGLRFRPGDRVVDLATGNRGEIVNGHRAPSTGRGVYVVKFENGIDTHRDDRELELDRAVAPAPASR